MHAAAAAAAISEGTFHIWCGNMSESCRMQAEDMLDTRLREKPTGASWGPTIMLCMTRGLPLPSCPVQDGTGTPAGAFCSPLVSNASSVTAQHRTYGNNTHAKGLTAAYDRVPLRSLASNSEVAVGDTVAHRVGSNQSSNTSEIAR